jgi:hypothetical protein
MFNQKPPKFVALAAAGLASIAMLSPATAGKSKPAGHPAPQDQVLAACDRTVGCTIGMPNPANGHVTGCTANVCFTCNGKTCSPAVAKPNPVNRLPVGQVDGVSNLLHRPTAVTQRAPVTQAYDIGSRPVAVAHSDKRSGHK